MLEFNGKPEFREIKMHTRNFRWSSNAHSLFTLWGRRKEFFGGCFAFLYFWVNVSCEEYVRWYLIMCLLWISRKCDTWCLIRVCYVFFYSSISHPLMSQKQTLRKRKKERKEIKEKKEVAQKILINAM